MRVVCSNYGSKLSSKRITFRRGKGVKMQMLRYECKCGVKGCRTLGEIECKPEPWIERKPMVKRDHRQWEMTWNFAKIR